MKRFLFIIALLLLFNNTQAQCPDGAGAGIVFYIHQVGISPSGPPVIDTSNTFYVSNFQAGTTVYLYTNYNTLIDSVFTSINGSGNVNLSPSVHDSLWPSGSGFTSVGFATNGICTTAVGGVGLLPVKISKFSVTKNNNTILIGWHTEMDEPGTKYIPQQSDDGINFTDITTIVSTSTNRGSYSYTGLLFFNKTKYYRIKVVTRDQKFFYSEIKVLNKDVLNEIVLSVIGGKTISVAVPENFVSGYYSIYNEAGSLQVRGRIFSKTFALSPLTGKGVYHIRFADSNGKRVTKSFIILD